MKKRPYLKLFLIAFIAAVATGVLFFEPASSTSESPIYSYRVVNEFDHDPGAYTQGLIFRDGQLWESTGLHGQSSVRRVDLQSGAVTQRVDIDDALFGEGITMLDGKIYQLTWKAEKGFIYGQERLEPLGEFTYEREGWGITENGRNLILSDGTSVLRWLDPDDFSTVRTIDVMDGRRPVSALNELEYVDGEIWANVYKTDRIVRINPKSGRVVGWIDLSGLLPTTTENAGAEVLNGIAYDADTKRIFVTGKRWPKLYEIEVVAPAHE